MKDILKDKIKSTPSSIYLMHKYWGKKPSDELKYQILKYSKKNDTIFDPFAGYGGLGIEAMIEGRNVILNDLNPAANFIAESILQNNIDIKKLKSLFNDLKEKYINIEDEWYKFKGNKIITILRNKENCPLKVKIYNSNKKMEEYNLTEKESKEFLKQEEKYKIKSWYPNNKIIQNSRICSNGKLKISDLFPKRALICQSELYRLISELQDSNEKNLLKFAFTSNLANCSKLVPPITSRGEMAQGAWMTGFYIGETYLENNVFHYFENRVKKVIKGKEDYLKLYNKKNNYEILCNDAKNLSLKNESIDFIFTDFPYGDTVPYFEQSQIWNAWLSNEVDYENEIVVSDSKERNKNQLAFANDIDKSISEICRVLKTNKYFTFTFHSLSGEEWEALSNSLLNYPFQFVDFKLLIQKTFTPRQLNRKQSIKGDLVVTYKKVKQKQLVLDFNTIEEKIIAEIKDKCIFNKLYETNDLIVLCVGCLLKYNQISNSMDFESMINKYFVLDNETDKWKLKEDI